MTDLAPSDTVEMFHEDGLPGHERKLTPKPDWTPRFSRGDEEEAALNQSPAAGNRPKKPLISVP